MSNNNLIPFEFNGKKVRTLVEEYGEVWFVVVDIATIIKHTNPSHLARMVDKQDLQKVYVLDANGRRQKVWVTNESGVYQILLGSTVKEAKPFCRWVTSEVLPSIRKTGRYNLPGEIPPPSSKPATSGIDLDRLERLKYASIAFDHAIALANKFNLSNEETILSANRAVEDALGVNYLDKMGLSHKFTASKKDHLIPSDFAQLFNVTARFVNITLEDLGLQERRRDRHGKLEWVLTETGLEHGYYVDTNKQHSDGTPVRQIFWWDTVTSLLKEALTTPSEGI